MFGKLAHLMYQRRWYVLSTWLVVLLVAGALAGRVGSVLDAGDFTATGSDSARATQVLDLQFHQNDRKVMLVVFHHAQATVRDATFRAAVQRTATRLRADRALQLNYLDNPLISGNRQLIASDRHGV